MSQSNKCLVLCALLTYTVRLGLAEQSYLPFLERDGLLVMEAESVPVVEPWKYETGVEGYTGDGYYRFDGNSVQTGPPDGLLSYKIVIRNPGTYRMELRSYKNDPDGTWANDCFTRMVDHPGYQGGTTKTFQPGNTFEWNYSTQHDYWNGQWEDKPIPYYTFENSGLYTFEIQGRSKNFHIDRIVFFDESKVNEGEARNPLLPESERREVEGIQVVDSQPVSPPNPSPTLAPSSAPTIAPITKAPTSAPVTNAPVSASPTVAPTSAPIAATTSAPVATTMSPTGTPITDSPMATPSPSTAPTAAPTAAPTVAPVTNSPTQSPTSTPTSPLMTLSPTPLRISQTIPPIIETSTGFDSSPIETSSSTTTSVVVTWWIGASALAWMLWL